MVHIEDMGSQFDAPIDVVWKYLRTEEDHARVHANRRNFKMEPDREGGMRWSWEQNVEGRWVKVADRVSLFAPVAMLVHSLEGPFAGSKYVFYYAPNGDRTGVNVVGDFQSATIPPERLESAVLASFEEEYNEDNRALRAMAGKG